MSESLYPYEYVAEYAFELIEPIDGKHGGYASIAFGTNKKVESEEDWDEVSRQCFKAGEGKYSRIQVIRVGEYTENTEVEPTLLIEGQIIE